MAGPWISAWAKSSTHKVWAHKVWAHKVWAHRTSASAGAGRGFLLASAICALMLIPLFSFSASPVQAAEPAVAIPAPTLDETAPANGELQTAVLAGGCFWGMQAVYQHTKGVTQ